MDLKIIIFIAENLSSRLILRFLKTGPALKKPKDFKYLQLACLK